MVIHYLDLISSIGFPNETNSPLVINVNTMATISIIQNLFNGTFVTFIEVHPLKRMPNPYIEIDI